MNVKDISHSLSFQEEEEEEEQEEFLPE